MEKLVLIKSLTDMAYTSPLLNSQLNGSAHSVTNESIFDAIYSMDLGTFLNSSEAERAAIRPKFETVITLHS